MRRAYPQIFFVLSLALLDTCGLILAFEAAYTIRFHSTLFLSFFPITRGLPSSHLYYSALFGLIPTWLIIFAHTSLYRSQMVSAYDEFIQVLKAMLLCTLITSGLSFTFRSLEFSRLVIGLWAIIGTALCYGLRELDKQLFIWLSVQISGPKNVLVVGGGKVREAIQQMAHREPFVRVKFVEYLRDLAEIEKYVQENAVSELLLIQGSLSPAEILETARICEAADIDCRVVPDLLEMRRGQIIFDGFCGLPTFHIKPLSLYGANYWLKRAFDLAACIVIVAILFVPMVMIMILVRLDSAGPVFFTQDRVGLRGRRFMLYKFRTMAVNADRRIDELKHLSDRSGPVFKMKSDPRVTRVGRFLRKYSLDELPQIINVLLGDMSLVGPRPQVIWEAAHYDESAIRRLRVLPGITGLWQVSGRAALSYEEMINLDIYYLENWSLGLDLKIMLRTVPAIFAKEGAY